MMVYLTLLLGIVLSVAGFLFTRPMASFLGATPEMMEDCVLYGRIVFCFITTFMLQNVFQSFFVTAEKPTFGLLVTIGAGLTNIVLDYLLVGIFNYGLVGAAAATAASQIIGGTIPIIYFVTKNSSLLRLTKMQILRQNSS